LCIVSTLLHVKLKIAQRLRHSFRGKFQKVLEHSRSFEKKGGSKTG
jgi:hypothetical protein